MKTHKGFVSNSSTSSFICDTELSAEQVNLKLRELWAFYAEWTDDKQSFEEVFQAVWKDNGMHGEQRTKCGFNDYGEVVTENKIIIKGNGDNAIPSDLFDMIERKFNATRLHWG